MIPNEEPMKSQLLSYYNRHIYVLKDFFRFFILLLRI